VSSVPPIFLCLLSAVSAIAQTADDRYPIHNLEGKVGFIDARGNESAQGFSESCSCTINLDPEQIEISSGGSQYEPEVGSDAYGLESFKWFANGEVDRKGDRDTWLERLASMRNCDITLYVTDDSADECPESD
jgi:hypothetical protein